MILELKDNEYDRITHIANNCKNTEVSAVVKGNNPGKVYVDHPLEPTAALVWLLGLQGFQLIGDPHSNSFRKGLKNYLKTQIEPKLKLQGIHHIEIACETKAWSELLQDLFGSRNINSSIQYVFGSRGEWEFEGSAEYGIRIEKIDGNMNKAIGNYSFLEEKIDRFWNAPDLFLKNGIGYYAQSNNQVIGICFSSFVADQIHAIDIETIKEYRMKKVGIALAQSFMQECSRKNILPYWDCNQDNSGSIRIAKSIGLTHLFDYKVFWYEI